MGLPAEILRIIAESKMRRETRNCTPRLRRLLAHVTVLEALDYEDGSDQIEDVELHPAPLQRCPRSYDKALHAPPPASPEEWPPSYEKAVHASASLQKATSTDCAELPSICHEHEDQTPELHPDDSSNCSDSDSDEWSSDEECTSGKGRVLRHGEVLTVDEEAICPDFWAQLAASAMATKQGGLRVDVQECGDDDT